jgi:hypothetical protein
VWFAADGAAGGLVAAGGVDGELSFEAGVGPDGEVLVLGDDKDGVAGEVHPDADEVVLPAEVALGADGVE